MPQFVPCTQFLVLVCVHCKICSCLYCICIVYVNMCGCLITVKQEFAHCIWHLSHITTMHVLLRTIAFFPTLVSHHSLSLLHCMATAVHCPHPQVPQNGIEVTLTIVSLTPGAVFAPGGNTASVVVAPCSQPVYSFAQESRFLVTEGRREVSLTIERPRCIYVSGNVLVSSSTPTQPVQLGALTLPPAMKGVDFTSVSRVVQFSDGEVSVHHPVPVPLYINTFP